MTLVSENEFRVLSGREFWVTGNGDKLFAHEFEDEHLKNTILMLHRKCAIYRLEEARKLHEMVHRTGHENIDIQRYYQAFSREMNKFMDKTISNKQWLKENSKIYVLLSEEATYRGLEIPDETKEVKKTKLKYKTISGQKFTYPITMSNTRSVSSSSLWA
jgi:hypothetical protein